MKHLRYFENLSDYEVAKDNLDLPNMAFVEENKKVYYAGGSSNEGGDNNEPEVDNSNGHEYVDLGLSVKWATCNVGASSPEEYGLYFAWGETDGYSAEQVGVDKQFNWDDYKYGTDGSNYTEYNSTDGKLVLDLTDDAAHVYMGGNWRMPTEAECQELIDNTTTVWTTVNGVSGMQFTSKSDASKSIFVPAAGNCYNGSVNDAGSLGNLWSSSLLSSRVANARYLEFGSGDAYTDYDYRYLGYSVRGVLA